MPAGFVEQKVLVFGDRRRGRVRGRDCLLLRRRATRRSRRLQVFRCAAWQVESARNPGWPRCSSSQDSFYFFEINPEPAGSGSWGKCAAAHGRHLRRMPRVGEQRLRDPPVSMREQGRGQAATGRSTLNGRSQTGPSPLRVNPKAPFEIIAWCAAPPMKLLRAHELQKMVAACVHGRVGRPPDFAPRGMRRVPNHGDGAPAAKSMHIGDLSGMMRI